MSVINNVLKDLESRESKFTPIEIEPIGHKPAAARNLTPWLLVVLLGLALVAAAWIYLQQRNSSGLGAASMTPVDSVATAGPTVSKEPEVVPGVVTDQMIGNQIIGLQIRETEDNMRLEFALREKVVAYLRERGENSFGYHLRDIESQILAPVINDNRWIEELEITTTDRGVDVNFETADDILVETRQSLVDGEPIWAISLRKSAIADNAIQTTSGGSPTPVESRPEQPPPVANDSSDAVVAEAVVKQDPDAAVAAAEVKLDIRSTNPDAKSINQLEYAVELINSRRLVKAQAVLRALLNGSEDYDARQHLLALYARQNQQDRFLRLARESISKYPNEALFKTEYARSLFQTAAYRSVIELLRDAAPVDASQQALLAASYQRLDQHEAAVRHYQLALEQDRSNAKNWIGLGISQEHTSALEDALNSYQQATRLGSLNDRLQAFVDGRSRTLGQVLN